MKPVNAYLGYDPSRVSRVNEIDSTIHSWESVLFQQGKSVMDFDLNVLQNILRNSIGSLAKNIFDGSGFFKTPSFSVIGNTGILMMPKSCDVNIYGRTVKVQTTKVNLQTDKAYPAAGSNPSWGNFFWLEFWYEEITPVTVQNELVSAGDEQKKTYQVDAYGGEDNRSLTSNPYNNIIDPIYGAETSRRVQLRWRMRSTKITNRATNPLGFGPNSTTFGGNGEVLARGGRADDQLNYVFYRSSDYPLTESTGTTYEATLKNSLVDFSSPRDEYLYIAGRGTANDAKILNTVDGRVYGIPICMSYVTANTNWAYNDLSHVVGIRTGSVIAGGSALIGTHVHLLINEGYDGADINTGALQWDRITLTAQQDDLLGRPNFPADIYLVPDDVEGNAGYVIPTRVLVKDNGTAALPSLSFFSSTLAKNKKSGFSYLEASNTDSLIVSVSATNIGQFFKDSASSRTTKIRQWEMSAIAENGLVVSGSIEASLDALVERRLIVGYSQINELTAPGLAGGTGLKIKIDTNPDYTIQILDGGSGYHVGDEVVVVSGSTTSTATVTTLSSGTKQVSGSLSVASNIVTFTCDVNSDVAGISAGDKISVVSGVSENEAQFNVAAEISVVTVLNAGNSFTISGLSSVTQNAAAVLKIETTLGARAGCVGTLSAFSATLGIGTYSPELATATKYRTSRIKQLRTSYIAAEKAILKYGIINGYTNQSDGVDITGNINANARVELRVNSSVFATTGSSIKNKYPKARSINFISGPLINLSGQMNDASDIYSLTISGALDAFNLSYDTLSPKYYFIAGRVYNQQPQTGTTVISGMSGDSTLSNEPFVIPVNDTTYEMYITVGLSDGTQNDVMATVPVATSLSRSSTRTLTTLAGAMQTAVRNLLTVNTTARSSNVSVNGAEILYSTNTGFSFDTKSSAVWKSITANAALNNLKFLEKIGVESKIQVNNVAVKEFTLSFYDDSLQFASIAPRMIVTDLVAGTADDDRTKIRYVLRHMFTGASFTNAATFICTVIDGQLSTASGAITVANVGSGYQVGDVLTVNGYGSGTRGSVRVTGVTTTGITGQIISVAVFESGSNYPITNNPRTTTRQDFIEVVNLSTSADTPYLTVNYPILGLTVDKLNLVFSSSITNIGNEPKTFINSGDRHLSTSAQMIRNDQTAQSNFMKQASLPSDVWVEGRSSIAARRDHRHEREQYQNAASSLLPSSLGAPTIGSSLTVSRGDHTHGWPANIPVGVSFGAPPADTDGASGRDRRVGTATEFFGLTGPAGKQRDNLVGDTAEASVAKLQGADALKSALAIWDTDIYNSQISNTQSTFSGYISAENRAVAGNWLTITTGGTISALGLFMVDGVLKGSIITVSTSTGTATFEATSNVISTTVGSVQRNYVTIKYISDTNQSTVVTSIGSASNPQQMIAKSPLATENILPDVGGRIVFGGKVTYSGSDYAVFGGIRGGKVNTTPGDRNGYLSLEARYMGGYATDNNTQTRYLTEFLRGYNTGHVTIGTLQYGSNIAQVSDLMNAQNILRTMGDQPRKLRVMGKSLFEDGILMNKGKAEFTNIVATSGTPNDALVEIWSTNQSARPMISLMQRSVTDQRDTVTTPYIYETSSMNKWNTYLTQTSDSSGAGHYTIALSTLTMDTYNGFAIQAQRTAIGNTEYGSVSKVIMYPNAQIGSTLNNIAQVKRTLTFQTRDNTSGSALGGMNWILSSDTIGGDRNNNYAQRSFAVSAVPLGTSGFAELSGGTTQVGKPGQPGTLSPNFQTFVLTDFSNASNLLLYNKRVDFDANVTVNGMEITPNATTTVASFLNTTPQNIFEVYQGTTDKPWRLGTYNKLANLRGNFTASTSGQNNTVLSDPTNTTYNGVYGFLAGQKFTIGLNTYIIQSVDYVAKTITLTASTSLSGSITVTVEDVSGGLKGQFDRIANEYRLGFITRDNSLWNTGSIEFNDLHFRTGSGASLRSKMYIANNGNVGIADNYFKATTAPSTLLHLYEATGTVAISATGTPTTDLNDNYKPKGTLILEHGNQGGASSIVFRSNNNSGSDYGYIQYQDTITLDGTTERSRLIIGTQNDVSDAVLDTTTNPPTLGSAADDVVIWASGAIIGKGTGVAGLFAPRVSIPAQSFVVPPGGGIGAPMIQQRAANGSPDGITSIGWNRHELIYQDGNDLYADSTISLPYNYTPDMKITVRIIWYGDNTTGTTFATTRSGTVNWEVFVAAVSPVSGSSTAGISGVLTNRPSMSPISINPNGTSHYVNWNNTYGAVLTETKLTWTPVEFPNMNARPGDLLGIRLQRNGLALGDTFQGNAFVLNLILEFGNETGTYFDS